MVSLLTVTKDTIPLCTCICWVYAFPWRCIKRITVTESMDSIKENSKICNYKLWILWKVNSIRKFYIEFINMIIYRDIRENHVLYVQDINDVIL